MKHLINWKSWKINESSMNNDKISEANKVFNYWVASILMKDVKIEVNEWTIPFRISTASEKKGSYKVKVVTASYFEKRFFIGLWAPYTHDANRKRHLTDYRAKWDSKGVVYLHTSMVEELKKIENMKQFAYFFMGSANHLTSLPAPRKVREPQNPPIHSIITKFFKKYDSSSKPADAQIMLCNLHDIICQKIRNKIPINYDLARLEETYVFWHCFDKIKEHIAKEIGDEKLEKAKLYLVDKKEFFAYPYCLQFIRHRRAL